jgi:pimeloyl-ACP methyl ester carboxylesterase
MSNVLRVILAAAFAAALTSARAQSLPPGPQLVTFFSQVDDSNQPYALYVPPDLDLARKYPLLISLHAEDTSPQICLMRVFGQTNRLADGSLAPLRFFPARDVDMIVACPLARGTMGYEGIAERDVYDVLADIRRRLPVDDDRVYLTGIGMGGGGALRLALTRPDLWAAVAAICPEIPPALEPSIPNALNLPVRLFQGELDPIVPAQSVRLWQRHLLDLGVAVDYLEYPAARHNAWDYAYKDGAVLDWFTHFRRNPYPERVRFVTDSYQYASAYWVRIDGLAPGVLASVDARLVGTSEARVDTQNLDGFTLSLDHRVASVTIDGALHHIPPAATVSFHKTAGTSVTTWVKGIEPRSGKGPGAEGPIVAAVSGRHIYVYGTLGASSAEELDQRRAVAEHAAEWSTARERLQLRFTIKPDTTLTPDDLDQNLVLFGTSESNSVIARLANRLPLALSPGAADYGLLFVAPAGKHYVLVSSGLPWWTGEDEAGRVAGPFEPQPFAELATFGDFMVFKGSVAHVVAEGRFDRQWKLPADAAAKLAATGAVSVR